MHVAIALEQCCPCLRLPGFVENRVQRNRQLVDVPAVARIVEVDETMPGDYLHGSRDATDPSYG